MAVAPVGGATDAWTMSTSTTAPGANPWTAVARSSNTNIVLATGDVLWAQVTWNPADAAAPNMAVPSGWTVPSGWPFTQGNAAMVICYRVVTDAGTEPASYTWQPKAADTTTDAAARGAVGIRAYRGVDTTTPLDVAPARTSGLSGSAGAAITAPQVTTVTAGAYVVSGLGVDAHSATTTITHPTGLNEVWDVTGKRQSFAEEGVQAVAGASGTLTWSISTATLNYNTYQAALRPAASSGDTGSTVYGWEVTIR